MKTFLKRRGFIVSNIVRLIIFLSLIVSVFEGITNPEHSFTPTFTILLALSLTFLPTIITKRWKVYLPQSLQVTLVIFIFCSVFLGEAANLYTVIPWWDTMLHSVSGIILGFIGFALVHSLNEYNKNINKSLTPFFIAFFAFCFALAAGAVWEIFEYIGDNIFNMNMQKWQMEANSSLQRSAGITHQGAGLTDTMEDLIVDAIGAFIMSSIGYAGLKSKKFFMFDKNIENDNLAQDEES